MYKMSDFKRNRDGIMKQLVVQDDKSVYAKAACSIIIPARWLNTRLANIDDGCYVLAYVMVKIKKEYMLITASGIIQLGDTTPDLVTIDGVECVEFKYEAGELIIMSLMVPVDNTIPYYMTNIITKLGARIPYASHDDFVKLLDTVPTFCHLALPAYCYTNIYMDYICRDVSDLTKPARLAKSSGYTSIGLNDIQYSVQNTYARHSGAYLDVGIQASLINPSKSLSTTEKIIRS